MNYGKAFRLTLFTNDTAVARKADKSGVNRIGLDLEQIGKESRQSNSCNWISHHTIDDLDKIKKSIKQATLFCRVNPINEKSEAEINLLINSGVKSLMLPMFKTIEHVRRFIDIINGRAEAILLLETAAGTQIIDQLVKLDGVDEIHIGLNDLSISLGLQNHFSVLFTDTFMHVAETINSSGIKFGFGGIGRANDTSLPVPSDLVYVQYPRFKATGALISQVYLKPEPGAVNLDYEISASRKKLNHVNNYSEKDFSEPTRLLKQYINNNIRS